MMPLSTVEFHGRMLAYFAAEKRESLLFLAVGVVALAAAGLLWRSASVYRAMIAPLALVGVIQVVVGASVLVRTDDQVGRLSATLRQAPARLRAEERVRMQRVMANFKVYKTIEVVVLVAGLLLSLGFAHGRTWHAVGIGCLLQGGLMLLLDLFAEGRGLEYLAALARLA